MGDLRWEKPVAPSSWEGVRNATEVSPYLDTFRRDYDLFIRSQQDIYKE